MLYTQRNYQDETDYAAMRGLVAYSYARLTPHAYMHLGDLDWWRALQATEDPSFLATVQLWFAGDELAGVLWPGKGSADFFVHPHHAAVDTPILAWAEANLPQPDEPGGPQRLRVYSQETDAPRNALLLERGYTRVDDDFMSSNHRDLDDVPALRLPEGFSLRAVREDEVEARVAVHRAAFGTVKLTLAKYLAARAARTYRPDLDLVAVAPDGRLAAFTICWYDAGSQAGYFEPVGCHPDFQRRGLASAVMVEGMRRLKALGATRTQVLAWLDTSPGALTYRSLGFQTCDRFYGWDKHFVAPGED